MNATPASQSPTRNELFAQVLSQTGYQHLPGGRKKLATLVSVVAAHRPRRVLDVGCGNGSLTLPVAFLGVDVVGTDVDSASIETCRARNSFAHARFVRTDGSLSEIEGTFDLILCSEVLEHLEDPDALLTAMCAKLAPGGRILITIPNGYGLREIGGRVERSLREMPLLRRLLPALRRWLTRHGMVAETVKVATHSLNPDQGHVQKFTRPDIERRLQAHDLEVVDWKNSFVILSVFRTRSGLSAIERVDSWMADHLPPACASGWYIQCEPRRRSAADGSAQGSMR